MLHNGNQDNPQRRSCHASADQLSGLAFGQAMEIIVGEPQATHQLHMAEKPAGAQATVDRGPIRASSCKIQNETSRRSKRVRETPRPHSGLRCLNEKIFDDVAKLGNVPFTWIAPLSQRCPTSATACASGPKTCSCCSFARMPSYLSKSKFQKN